METLESPHLGTSHGSREGSSPGPTPFWGTYPWAGKAIGDLVGTRLGTWNGPIWGPSPGALKLEP